MCVNLRKALKVLLKLILNSKKNVCKIFEKDLVPERILEELILFSRQPIIPGKTLLFFDEIQACPDALLALRYFYEQMPHLHVLAAGSLLEFTLEKIGIPVGRVTSLFMYPLSFMEYLVALGENLLVAEILKSTQFSETIHTKALDLLGQYLAIGGMPEATASWIETKNALEVFKIHHHLIDDYRQDFQKYAKKHQIVYLEELFDKIPRLVGQQFKYTAIHGEYKKRELAPCLNLLCLANVAHKIHHSAGNGLPLGAESNANWFKIMFLDTALCQATLGLDLASWILDQSNTFVNRGMIIESFVAQELLCYSPAYRKAELYFWKEEGASQAEVDFLYDYKNEIIPIEAKSGDGRSLKSLHLFLKKHPSSSYGVRFSPQNYSMFDAISSRPLYAVVSLAHEEQKESLLFICGLLV